MGWTESRGGQNDPDHNPLNLLPEAECIRCGYSLGGLAVPRCPECGRLFDPDDSTTYLQPDHAAVSYHHPPLWLSSALPFMMLLLGYGHCAVGWLFPDAESTTAITSMVVSVIVVGLACLLLTADFFSGS